MDLKYKIARKPRRRTLSIVISRDNQIVVRANHSLTEKDIADFVQSKRSWISKTVNFNKAILSLYKPKKFADGEKFLYLGKEVTLRVEGGKSDPAELIDNIVLILLPAHVKNPEDYVQNRLMRWYVSQSKKILDERISFYSRTLNVRARKVKIRTLKSTWANCSPQGVLTFSWRLLMAPLNIIDYVVIHELAHRLHHNHSLRFWKQVENVMPEYRVCRKWLRDNESSFRW